jgi:precorrin-4 methylase
VLVGLHDADAVFARLLAAMPGDTPVAVVWRAGYAHGEQVARTTLAEAAAVVRASPERHLGVVYVGPGVE